MAGNVIEVTIRAKDEATRTINNLTSGLRSLEARGGPLASVFGGVAGGIEAIGPAGLVAAAGLTAVAVASVAATRAFVDVVKEGADIGDALNKMASQTGLTVEELSKLKFAADQNESSLEAVASAAKFMSKNLYEAQQGGKEARDTLAALGFTGDEAAGHLGTTSEALVKVADKLKAIPDQGTRVALALKLMGRGAIESLPLFQQGGDVIVGYGQKLENMNAVVTTTAGVLGDNFNDALSKVRTQMDALKTKVAENALPAFITVVEASSGAVEKFAAAIESNKDAIALFADTIASVANVGISITVKGIEAVHAASKALEPLVAAARFLRDPIGVTFKGVDKQFQRGTPIAPTPEAPTGTTAPNKRILSDAEKKAIADAKAEAEKFATALQRAYLVSDQLGESLKAAFGVKPATGLIADFQKELEAAAAAAKELRGVPTGQDGKPLSAAGIAESKVQVELPDLAPLDEIPLKIDAAGERALALSEIFEGLGLNVEGLLDRLTAVGESLDGIGAIGAAVSGTLSQGLAIVFDPMRVAIEGTMQAVSVLGQQFDALGSSLIDKLIPATVHFRGITGAIEGATRAMLRFVASITLAIAKALVLKAITTVLHIPFLSSGGGISKAVTNDSPWGLNRGGSVGLSQGGGIARLSSGGAITNVFNSITQPIVRLVSGGSVVNNVSHFVSGGAVNNSTSNRTDSMLQKISHFVQGGSVNNSTSSRMESVVNKLAHFVSGGSVANNSSSVSNVSHFVRGGAVAAGLIGLATGGSLAMPRLASGGSLAPTYNQSQSVDARRYAFSRGGAVAHLASGGAISNQTSFGGHSTHFGDQSFSNVIHAADGLRLVPGFPQSYDSVPAMLAPGEVVLPNVGGKSPSDLLGNLGNLSRDLSVVIARSQQPNAQGQGAAAPMFGEIHIHANDADSVRHSVRPGGEFGRQLARSDELGRASW